MPTTAPSRPPPKISAIVPAYNVERYVAAALDSLLAQTVPFHEIIVVDDGSTDGTADILRRYATRGVTVLHEANTGQGAARNAGIEHAEGDFVYFFDADDLLDPGFVKTVGGWLAAAPDLDLVFFSGTAFRDADYDGGFMPAYGRRIAGSFSSGLAAAEALAGAESFFASPCLYVSKRSLWSEHRLAFAPVSHEDEEMILRLCLAAGPTQVKQPILFRRRLRPGSTMTGRLDGRRAAGMLYTLASTARLFRENSGRLQGHQAFLRRRLAALYGAYLQICADTPQPPAIAVCLWSYLRLGWRPPVKLLAKALRQRFASLTPRVS